MIYYLFDKTIFSMATKLSNRIWIKILIRILPSPYLIGRLDPDPDPKEIFSKPQHCFLVKCPISHFTLNDINYPIGTATKRSITQRLCHLT